MAWRMSSSAIEGSVISPLRTPRERACPRPTTFNALSAESSPTTAQTFDVPTSRPTMIEEEGSNMFLFEAWRFRGFRRHRRNEAGFEPFRRDVVTHRQVQGPKCFADLLAFLLDLIPAAKLLLEIVCAERDLAAIGN